MNDEPRYTIKKATKKDIPRLLNVFQAAVRLTANRNYAPEQVEAWASRGTPARFLELFDSGLYFFMAESGSCCIGFTSVSSQGLLHSLFVTPESQRKGVATALLEKAIQTARENGAENIAAEVSITALPFFRRAGFTVTQEQKVFIGGIGLTNYRMQLTT